MNVFSLYLTLFMFICSTAFCQWTVYAPEDDASGMVERHLSRLRDEGFAQRSQRYEERTAVEEIATYQRDTRRFFLKQLGEWPAQPGFQQTSDDSSLMNRYIRDGFIVETRLIKIFDGYYVPATLYLPPLETMTPYPAVLVPCGHSTNGRAADVYQRACILLARNGIAALIYDPIDQGERYQLLNNENRPIVGNTTGHTMLGIGSILLGRNTATFRIFDGLCMIEYLKSRKDIDPARIGCTGNSGGGTLTSYLMALSEDIVCAAPSCYLTTLQHQEPQDAEQNIFGQIAYGMDHADYVMMRAPRPTLMCAATRDFFDINGTWKAFREAKRLYTRLGFGERVSIIETDATHGFSIQLREGMVRWMLRWLKNEDTAITEPYVQVLRDEELYTVPGGHLYAQENVKTTYDLNREYEAGFRESRSRNLSFVSDQAFREEVRRLAAIRPLDEIPQHGDMESHGSMDVDGMTVSKHLVPVERDLKLPVLRFSSGEPNGSPLLYLHGEGKSAEAGADGEIRSLVARGYVVYSVDMRNCGELTPPGNHADHVRWFGPGWQNYYLAYWLGKSFVGIRAEDTLSLSRVIQELHSEPPHVIAIGETGIAALHAVFLHPEQFASVDIRETIPSWTHVIDTDLSRNQLINTVHGALLYYDLPDMADRVEDQVQFTNPVDAMGDAL